MRFKIPILLVLILSIVACQTNTQVEVEEEIVRAQSQDLTSWDLNEIALDQDLKNRYKNYRALYFNLETDAEIKCQ